MVATVSDLAAAAGWDESPGGGSYINPDLTLQLTRLPRGEWIAVDARVEHGGNRAALLDAVVFDDHGPIGRVLQSLVEAPSPMARQAEPSPMARQAEPSPMARQESQR